MKSFVTQLDLEKKKTIIGATGDPCDRSDGDTACPTFDPFENSCFKCQGSEDNCTENVCTIEQACTQEC